MNETPKKTKYGVYLTPETMEKVEQLYKGDNAENRSVFIERAIEFYCGYLTAENYREYFPSVITSTFDAKLQRMEDRMARLLYKHSVELGMLLHVVAATNDIDDINLSQLRGLCNQEVSRTNGQIKFEDAVRYQKG